MAAWVAIADPSFLAWRWFFFMIFCVSSDLFVFAIGGPDTPSVL